jgi:hypothetical protein
MIEGNDKPVLDLGITIGDFDEEAHREAIEQLSKHFSVTDNPAYELSEAEIAHAVIALVVSTLQGVPAELLSSWLYDGLRPLLLPKHAQRTFFEFQIFEHQPYRGTRSVHANLVTDDEEALKEAMADFKELAKPEHLGKEFRFDSEDPQGWKESKS